MRRLIANTVVFFMALICCGYSQALVVLQYHHVSDTTPAITSISTRRFAEHMQYLVDNKFSVVDMKDLPALLEQQSLPDKAVIITFDDGYSSIVEHALPILKKHKLPFAVFISSEPHDQGLDGYLSWQQLKDLQKYSGTLANHSFAHEHLVRQTAGVSLAQQKHLWRANIEKNQQRIKEKTGSNEKFFAYPYGEYTPDLQALLKQMGYIAFGQLSGPISDSSSHTALPRFAFGGGHTAMDDFIVKVNTRPFMSMRSKIYDENWQEIHTPILPLGVKQPILQLRFLEAPPKHVQCFASGQDKTRIEQQQDTWVAQAKSPLTAGRGRYNCTASAGDNRFFWHSEFFMLRHDDGSWYEEY
jgi:peptidoglycan/xylan/chitin deacetylase (PgdA/CDA1 family)